MAYAIAGYAVLVDNLPLLGVGDGVDVKVFWTVAAAEAEAEPIDVESGVWEFFDSNALRLACTVERNRTRIHSQDAASQESDLLSGILRKSLLAIPTDRLSRRKVEIERADLAGLVALHVDLDRRIRSGEIMAPGLWASIRSSARRLLGGN